MEKHSNSKVGPLRRIIGLLFFAAAVAAVLGAVASLRAVNQPSSPEQAAALRKIAPWVTQHTAGGKQAEFMVVLADQADLSEAAALPTKNEKGRYVRDALWGIGVRQPKDRSCNCCANAGSNINLSISLMQF